MKPQYHPTVIIFAINYDDTLHYNHIHITLLPSYCHHSHHTSRMILPSQIQWNKVILFPSLPSYYSQHTLYIVFVLLITDHCTDIWSKVAIPMVHHGWYYHHIIAIITLIFASCFISATSLESWLVRGNIPKWPYFRWVTWQKSPRYIVLYIHITLLPWQFSWYYSHQTLYTLWIPLVNQHRPLKPQTFHGN